jgi:hypothetical protein
MIKNKKLLFRKFRRNLGLLANSFWVFPSIWLIYLVRPLVNIRFVEIYSSRIGNFISEVAEQLNSLHYKSKNEIRLFYFVNSNEISNSQWEAMIRRTLPIYQYFSRNIGKWIGFLSDYKSNHIIKPNLDMSSFFWKSNLSYQHDVSIKFLEDEDNFAKEWLKTFGWKENEPFICLNVRDSAYLRIDSINSPYFSENNRWNTLDFRNSKIDTYTEGIKWLNERGIWVLRMGKVMETPATYSNNKSLFSFSEYDLLTHLFKLIVIVVN